MNLILAQLHQQAPLTPLPLTRRKLSLPPHVKSFETKQLYASASGYV